MITRDPHLKNRFTQAVHAVQAFVQTDCTAEVGRQVLKRYTAAIEGNFVAWMGAATISARSVEGRFAASENLWVEMKDDHAGMLRTFAAAANAEPTRDDYQYVAPAADKIRSLMAEMSGLKSLVLMSVLENTSAVFVPVLATYAQALNSDNLLYTDVHGLADIEHADQFIWAVEHERQHYPQADKMIEDTIVRTLDFLRTILA